MTCKSCPPATAYFRDLYISQVQSDPQVKTGDTYHIYVDINTKMLLLGDYGRVCLYDGSTLLQSSKSFYLKKGESFSHVFTGTMPNKNLYLDVSLVDEQIYGVSDCADGSSVFIKNGPTTILIVPEDPLDPEKDDTIEDLTKLLIVVIIAMLVAKFI